VDINVNVVVENVVTDGIVTGVRFTVTVDDPLKEGDLRGIFFNLDTVSITDDDIVGDDITEKKVAENAVIRMDTQRSVSMQGAGNKNVFDLGVAIGEEGLKGGSDDFSLTVFTVSGITTDNIIGDVGIRLTSVTDGSGGREESSKIVGSVDCCRVEEPECGNGVIDLSEECDEGPNNGVDGSGCSSTCKTIEPEPVCESTIDETTCCAETVPPGCVAGCEAVAIDCEQTPSNPGVCSYSCDCDDVPFPQGTVCEPTST